MNRFIYALISAAYAYGSYVVLTDMYSQPVVAGLMSFGTTFFFVKTIFGDYRDWEISFSKRIV